MSLKKTSIAAFLAASGLVVSSAAMAQAKAADQGFYAGVSIGQSSSSDACTGVSGPGVSCDDKDTAFKIFGGYQINRNFGVELGYTDLGKVEAHGGGVTASVESTAFELVGVGKFPINNQFSVYGKLGFYRADSKGRSNVGVSADETNTDLTYGLGVQYNFTGNLGVRGEWQRYSSVGGGDIGDSDVDVLSVGVVYKF
ncbi:MAG TPA: outer membrane beta-barrel protein [Burkholderiales bacterium]|nr:outer membrane beta-barrel protein [Burkholderiales bacterium]